ncbi:AMP-dependent synthetase/ligase [Solicola sp. PLA-1-18]|uniref:AMP-dependent synthetase/ligase n=1 Tax=Solicola sp. PLA-1-18 TaxID=3380532 RepID=UPI003B75FFFF
MTTTAPASPDPSLIHSRARNVAEMFYARVEDMPGREAFRYPDGEGWTSITWGQAGQSVSELAAGLVALGVEPEQRVAIASGTRWEWILADLAINAAGAATTTVYPTSVADDVAYILADSESRVVFAEDDTQVAKLRERRDDLGSVVKVILIDGVVEPGDGWVVTLDSVLAQGADHLAANPDVVSERVAGTRPDSLATLIYTSGTTGRPKGVRIAQDSWTYEGAAVAAGGFMSIDDLEYRWLPMAHSFGKVLLTTQLQIGFPAAIDGRVDKIVENLAVVKPTFMGAAPRIFEKAYGRIVATAQGEGGPKAKIFDWAVKVGGEVSRRRLAGESVPLPLKVQHGLADKLVFAKVRDRFGGRVRFFISGSAALSGDVARWFHAAGILILEGYGLTETSAGSFVNHPDNYKFGTVGLPMEGTEARIAEDGEILLRGPGVMQGYHGLDEESEQALVGDGWLATGDIGEIDADGFLKITDRKKDLFKTSNGKYVAPSHVEGIFKGVCPLASQMIIHGNDRNFVSALITLDADAVADWASRNGQEGVDYETVVTSSAMREVIEGYVAELNAKLNRWEQVKKFEILTHDLSVESGEITPSLKVKRRVVEANYKDTLDGFYAG